MSSYHYFKDGEMPCEREEKMKDFRDNIGRHANFDDHRYWTFVRNSHIPHGEFDRRWKVDNIVFVACVILLALGLLAVNIAP